MNKRLFIFKTVLSAGVSLLVLALIMRFSFGQEAASRPHLLHILRETLFSFVALYLLFSFVQAFFRALRYRLLIRAAGEQSVPSVFHAFLVTLARNMFVDLFPARVGELSYIAMMNKGYKVSGKACVSSLTISFLFDLIALIVLLLFLVAFQIATSDVRGWLLYALCALAVVVICIALVLFVGIRTFTAVTRRILGRIAAKGPVFRMLAFIDDVADAVEFTRRSGTLLRTLGLSLLVRGAKYTGLCCLFYGVAKPNFPGLSGASLLSVLGTLVSAEAGASLPIPAFMSFGTYEAGGLLTLTLLGFSAAASKVAMLAIHIWSQCIDYALGGAGLVSFVFLSGRKGAAVPAGNTLRRYAFAACAGLVLLAGIGLLGLQYRKVKKSGSLKAPDKGRAVAVSPDQNDHRRAVIGQMQGFAVWSSNRLGNHDIWMMTFPDLSVTPLTSHPHVDTFPRISPDGRKVVFCRSQQPWVSQRNDVPWDVYMLDLERNEEVLVAANANVPSWSESGTKVYFQRKSGMFVSHDLETGEEKVLFRSGSGAVPERVHLQTPSFSTRMNAMAVTLRGKRRGTAVFPADGGERMRISRSACQLAWAPDSSFLYYVDHGGKQKTAFHRCEPDGGNDRMWLDSPGDYSHEYFPKLSNDKRYLVFGASTGGHEHDAADYEIFLWPVDAGPRDIVRLTFHTGNDCWPDVFVR